MTQYDARPSARGRPPCDLRTGGAAATQTFGGWKRCLTCLVWLDWDGKFCPCCRQQLRLKPKAPQKQKQRLKKTARVLAACRAVLSETAARWGAPPATEAGLERRCLDALCRRPGWTQARAQVHSKAARGRYDAVASLESAGEIRIEFKMRLTSQNYRQLDRYLLADDPRPLLVVAVTAERTALERVRALAASAPDRLGVVVLGRRMSLA